MTQRGPAKTGSARSTSASILKSTSRSGPVPSSGHRLEQYQLSLATTCSLEGVTTRTSGLRHSWEALRSRSVESRCLKRDDSSKPITPHGAGVSCGFRGGTNTGVWRRERGRDRRARLPHPLAMRPWCVKISRNVWTRVACVLLLLLLVAAGRGAGAQDTLRPAQGGYVHSLGLPEIYKPYVGVGIGLARGTATHLASQIRLGVFRDMGSPITELVGWAVEGYGGVRDVRADGGVRMLLLSNLLRIGAGLDYDVRDGAGDLLLTFLAPVRRGGIIGGGSDLRLEWLPTRGGSINLALTVPLHQPHRGSTRPRSDHVVLRELAPLPLAFGRPDSTLMAALDSVRTTAHWINRFVVPSLGAPGGDIPRSVARAAAPLKARLADHSVDAEIRAYHAALARAFSLAVSDGPLASNGVTPNGAAAAERAKAILLDRVLFPYNRLLGQNKKPDTTAGCSPAGCCSSQACPQREQTWRCTSSSSCSTWSRRSGRRTVRCGAIQGWCGCRCSWLWPRSSMTTRRSSTACSVAQRSIPSPMAIASGTCTTTGFGW